ncbi:hypothetical protein [Ferruginibacter sp.]
MNEFKPEEILNNDIDLATIESLPSSYIQEKVVLGIDIYKYSQYPTIEQIYIPVVFDWLYHMAAINTIKHEKYFFDGYGATEVDFKKKFISTGDGGFQIFDDVLQAVIFATYFQTALRRYVTGGATGPLEKNLYKVVSSLELRYAISRDKIYSYKSNYFGPAIINNARILSKDNLNRLLIDLNSISWLTKNLNAAENLLDIDKESLAKTSYFKGHDKSKGSRLFDTSGKILSVDLQKVGALKAKETMLDIFNMHLQAKLEIIVGHHDYKIYVVTLGNLNTSGINT